MDRVKQVMVLVLVLLFFPVVVWIDVAFQREFMGRRMSYRRSSREMWHLWMIDFRNLKRKRT